MKNLLIIITGLFLSSTCSSQSCLPEGITFSTQNQIDHFHVNYPNCSQIQGDVTIAGDNITNLDSLSGLTSVGGSLFLGKPALAAGNPDLTSITGLGSLTSIGGDLSIYSNGSLTTIAGLNKLNNIRGYLDIYENPFLTNLTELGSVTSLGGYLLIQDNSALTSLSGLDAITEIGGFLSIVHNINLTSIVGLNNINNGSIANLQIINNSFLSACAVKSICEYLAAPGGTVEIYGNNKGCSNQAEVVAACASLPVEQNKQEEGFSVYPNPSFDIITIETSGTSFNGNLSIMNLNGQELLTCQIKDHQTQLDISNLPGGIYFVRIIGNKTVKEEKIVKL
jgi:hypothetical protein